ncbi:YqiJ family protein [Salmonella enterica subsp. enterica serovar Legon]|nr:YqiJ family protein [Salmonella enterica subsp. enterica serovar Legon]EDZ3589452.1 DUF1449 family protein [Salmonella enterica subsp. enterica serovar Wagenia]
MNIFSDYNYPYLFALSFVLLIGIIEILSLLVGHMISGTIDAHLHDLDPGSPDQFSQFLNYLNIGRVPALVVLCLLFGCFGISGILIQHAWSFVWPSPLHNILLIPVCIIFAVIAAHYIGKMLSPWLPRDETTAIGEKEFIGRMAVITGPSASTGIPCEAKFTDEHGQIHYVLLEPEEGKYFTKGDKVLIIGRISDTRYLAEINPWPSIL